MGRFEIVVDRCGSLWVVVDRCGSFRLLVTTRARTLQPSAEPPTSFRESAEGDSVEVSQADSTPPNGIVKQFS